MLLKPIKGWYGMRLRLAQQLLENREDLILFYRNPKIPQCWSVTNSATGVTQSSSKLNLKISKFVPSRYKALASCSLSRSWFAS